MMMSMYGNNLNRHFVLFPFDKHVSNTYDKSLELINCFNYKITRTLGKYVAIMYELLQF